MAFRNSRQTRTSFSPCPTRSFLAFCAFLALPAFLQAQQIPVPPSPPSMGTGLTAPTVSAPSVSPVTAPVFGAGASGNGGAAGLPASSGAGNSSSSAANSASAAGSAAGTALSLSSLLGDSSNTLLSTLLGQEPEGETADDQLLSKLIGVLQGKGVSTVESGSVTAETLAAAIASKSAAAPSAAAAPAKASAASGAAISRFTLGAYDVTPTISLVASSTIAANGTFLISGDRSYLVSGRTLRETFYFLCRKNSDGSYTLHADAAQETANEWSACRRLAKLGGIRGEAAGNQILFRASDSAGPIYLLLTLFGPTADSPSVR